VSCRKAAAGDKPTGRAGREIMYKETRNVTEGVENGVVGVLRVPLADIPPEGLWVSPAALIVEREGQDKGQGQRSTSSTSSTSRASRAATEKHTI